MVKIGQGAGRRTEYRGGISRLEARGWLSLCLLLLVVCLSAPSWAQQSQQQPPTISVNVKVVNVLATVRTKHGEIIRNLTQDDFTLE